jgi:hypothetical protein
MRSRKQRTYLAPAAVVAAAAPALPAFASGATYTGALREPRVRPHELLHRPADLECRPSVTAPGFRRETPW